ncbi:Na(+)/H(+) antiporter subunit D [Fretibacter rubidus]|uniref:Na(+)/H(+) antiporter subunit D n=1 Tax=Fretibacter rubidus TaxID=570162 RepID=UPI00352A0F88
MTDLLFQINPGIIIILFGVLCALTPIGTIRKALLLAAPIIAGVMIFQIYDRQEVLAGIIDIGPVTLTTLRIDSLSMIWGYVFCLAGVLNAIYGFHEKCKITDSSALIYMGSAIAGVFAGDLLTLFIFWEMAAISSVFLIWKGGEGSFKAGVRYLAIHVLSGVLLLAGAVIYGLSKGGDFSFGYIGLDAPGAWLILLAMGIKVGFPFMHNWMQDAYPKASITGTVILAAFTTKLALYALARGFPGTEILIYIGAVMTCFPVFFAVIENDLRRVLAYSLNNQLGFMVCGIGIGSELAMNGVAAQVVAHVIFKGLLFMSIGAVMYRVGTAKASELGGLFRSMPFSTLFCLVGAMSISAFPLFFGFVTKSMIISAAIEAAHGSGIMWVVVGMLLFASAGVMEHSGIKVPYFTFFSHDGGHRVKEAPWNMLVAMGLSAFICIFFALPVIGYPLLYSMLPYAVDYKPYTGDHVVYQLQLLFAAMVAFALLKRLGVYPDERRAEILDFDWTYRKLGRKTAMWINAMWARLSEHTGNVRDAMIGGVGRKMSQMFSPAGAFSAAAPSGIASILTGIMLIAVLMLIFLNG